MHSGLGPSFRFRRTAVSSAILCAVLAQAALLTACGGGGGGGPSATLPIVPGPPDPGIPTAPPAPPAPPALPPLAAQYLISPNLLMTGYQLAHAQGHQGAGVTVAVLDTGFDPVFAEEFGTRLLPGFDAAVAGNPPPPVTKDVNTNLHGTHMARIIGGSGTWADGRVTMIGVAPQANVLPINVARAADGLFLYVREGLAIAANRPEVRIVNMSFSTGADVFLPSQIAWFESALRPALTAGKLMVASAGNSGGVGVTQPGYPARLAANPEFAAHMLVAGSVDANRVLAHYSQPAGDTMQRYLVAPGTVNMGTQNQPFGMTGTSNAAAMVSGAAAVVWGRWAYLDAQRVSLILLETAEDLGAPGVDTVYGRGLLRLDRAMQPRGELIVQSLQGQAVRLGQSVGTLSPHALEALRASGTQVQFRDEWDRHFSVSAAALFGASTQPSAAQQRDAVLREAAPQHHTSEQGVSFSFAQGQSRGNPLLKMSLQSGRVGAQVWNGEMFAPMHFSASPVIGRFERATGAATSWAFTGALQGHFHWVDGRALNGGSIDAHSLGLSWGEDGPGGWKLALHAGQGSNESASRGHTLRAGLSNKVASISYGLGASSQVSMAFHQGQQRQQLAKGFGGTTTQADAMVLNWQMLDAGLRGAQLHTSLTLPRSRTTHLSATLPTGVNMNTGASIYETLNLTSVQRIPARLDLAWSAPVSRADTLQVGMSASEDDSAMSVRWGRSF